MMPPLPGAWLLRAYLSFCETKRGRGKLKGGCTFRHPNLGNTPKNEKEFYEFFEFFTASCWRSSPTRETYIRLLLFYGIGTINF